MAKKKKGAFGIKDFVIVGGIAAVAYFIFSSFKKGTGNTTGNTTGSTTGNTTSGGGALPPAGNTNTTGCNLLVNGFVNAGYVPPVDATYSIAGEPVFRNLTEAELKAPLKIGQKGIHVMAFQIFLNSGMNKEDLIPIDGSFGNQTVTLMRKNAQKWPSYAFMTNAYDVGALNLEIMDNIVGVNVKSELKKFNAGFLPNCPQAKEFYFGTVQTKDGKVFYLSSVGNDY